MQRRVAATTTGEWFACNGPAAAAAGPIAGATMHVMCCIVVKRGEFNRYHTLYKAFSTQTPVIWDRRVGDRRQGWRAFDGPDRRAADRRGALPTSWQALKFVVVDDPAVFGAVASRMLASR